MTITRRGDGFQLDVTHKGTRYRRMYVSMHLAKNAESALMDDLWRRGVTDLFCTRSPVVDKHTLRDLISATHTARWLGTKSESSSMSAACCLERMLGLDRLVTDITKITVTGIITTMRTQGLKPATINRKLACLSALMSYAVDAQWVDSAPKIKYLKEPKGRIRWLSLAEQRLLFDKVESARMASLFLFLVETGVRRGEALNATWSQINDGYFTVQPTKGGDPRSIPMTQSAEWAITTSGGAKLSGPFADLTPQAVTRAWNAAKAKVPSLAKDPEVVPHCLRHTCASRLVQRGANLKSVQAWLGHTNIKQTMKYSHLAPGHLHDLRDLLQA